jgi:hypothetical protein
MCCEEQQSEQTPHGRQCIKEYTTVHNCSPSRARLVASRIQQTTVYRLFAGYDGTAVIKPVK